MNMPKKTDFIPEIAPQDAHLVAPDTYQLYEDDEEDRLHEQHLKKIEAEINEKFGAPEPNEELGELPYDAEADRKRWDELEKDFDRVFLNAARRAD
jgi:hypothetical protein